MGTLRFVLQRMCANLSLFAVGFDAVASVAGDAGLPSSCMLDITASEDTAIGLI
jgi:hypothetical protein